MFPMSVNAVRTGMRAGVRAGVRVCACVQVINIR